MRLLNRTIFLIGWLLSPFTTWNDAIVNIPLAYFSASLFYKFFPYNFTVLVIIFYWLTNGLGLLLMYAAGRNTLKEKELNPRPILITLLVYSLILFLIDKVITLKPL